MLGYLINDFEIDEKTENFFNQIESYFNQIFDAFLERDERLAHKLWFKNREFETEGKKLQSSLGIEFKYKIKILLIIVKICRNITALIY